MWLGKPDAMTVLAHIVFSILSGISVLSPSYWKGIQIIILKSSWVACLVHSETCTSGKIHIYKRGHSFMWTQAFSESSYIFSIDCETNKTMNTRNTSTMPFLAFIGVHNFLSLTVIKYIMVTCQGVCLHRLHWRTNVKNNYMHVYT